MSQSEGTWEKLSQVAIKGAEYDSPERRPHPKCLKETRVDLLDHIYDLLDDQEKSQLIWLNGTAGVGKSAVAFTVAEKMRGLKLNEPTREKRLAGTFFFSRRYTDRCTTSSFFATLVHQLATNFPSIIDDLNTAIRENPTLLDPKKSLRKQMEALFLRPLRRLQIRLCGCPPLVFVVDALDECTSETEISELISLLGEALHEPDLPVTHILLTSRTEAHIREAIHEEEVHPLVYEIPVEISGKGVTSLISLDGADVDSDICIFLKHSFTKLQRRCPNFPQPTEHELERLANRAGRRFIIASTMMKFIDDGHDDPRGRLQLMLELTCKLLPGTEVYRFYDLILSTCADPKRAYLHLSVVAALANPLPISQISELLGPGQGSDLETTLMQLRSVMDTPTDSSLPVNIYHSSIRDYVSSPSNCGLFEEEITSPHTLLAYSSLFLMVHDIPESTALLDALLELNTQSQAMESQTPQNLRRSLTFIVELPTALQVLITLLWLRGDRRPRLYSWLETPDGQAWLRTQGARAWLETLGSWKWLQTRAGLDWLQTQDGEYWLQTPDMRHWLLSSDGIAWLCTKEREDWLWTHDAREWLQSPKGSNWLQSSSRRDLLQSLSERDWLQSPSGRDWLQSPSGRDWVQSPSGRDWVQSLSERNSQDMMGWLQTPGGDWLESKSGRDWLESSSGRDWLQSPSGNLDWLQSPSGRNWLESPSGSGREWLQTWGGRRWLRTWGGREWLQTSGGREWLQTSGGREWLQTSRGQEWLQIQGGQEWLQTQSGKEWLQTLGGREWLQTQSRSKWLETRSRLQAQIRRDWLQTQSGLDWLQTLGGQDWLQFSGGQKWLRTQSGREWLQTRNVQEWLQTWGGQEWLQISGGREWLRTPGGREWLQASGGREWLQTSSGREWLQTHDIQVLLQTQSERDWLQNQSGRDWLQTSGGRDWLQTQDGQGWMQTQSGQGWLQTQSGQEWLQTQSGKEWLQTFGGREWLQTQTARAWLQTPHGKAWQSTPAASFWVHMEEFLDTVEATSEFMIIPELSSLPAFQAIQQFKSLPDFLMLPAFLTLTPQSPTSAFAEAPDMEIIYAIIAFVSFTNDARERSQSASEALAYACQNWAMHLSRAPNPWNNMLNHIFKVFWDHHLLSWLERQWCLKGLRSCLNVLSEGQKLTICLPDSTLDPHIKNHHVPEPSQASI